LIVLLLACSKTDAELTEASIRLLSEGRSTAAAAACLEMKETRAAEECTWHVAASIAASDDTKAASICAPLSEGSRDECLFRVAEGAGRLDGCSAAGSLERKCRLHFYRDGLATWVSADARVGSVQADAEAKMREYGLEPDVEAAWFRTYRYVIGETASDTTTDECSRLPQIPATACHRALEAAERSPDIHRSGG